VVNKLSRNYDPFIRPSSADAEATLELKKVLLQNSREVLRKYLFRYREKKGYASIGEDAKKIFEWVDLVLLQLVLEMPKEEGRQILYDIIDSGVDCFEEAEKVLMGKERYYVLSRLYQSRGMVVNVLETWAKMIDGTWPDDEFRKGEERMRDYLIKCRDAELVLKFGLWLTRRNPEAGVQVRYYPPSLELNVRFWQVMQKREPEHWIQRKLLRRYKRKVLRVSNCIWNTSSFNEMTL
jgi:vacuolar protein sorting-associated protein 3